MRRLITTILALVVAHGAWANEGPALQDANVDLRDTASLQRGAKFFVNYCVSCHSASFMRYNRVAKDLGIPEKAVASDMMFTTDKIGETMQVAMKPADAEKWFGVVPPDLSVVARARGADWIYTFLQSFYLDPSRPTGVNNVVFPSAAMPHVLWELQGVQRAVFKKEKNAEGKEVDVLERLETAVPGKLSDAEYKQTVHDIVNFMVYMGEPAKLVRYKVGAWVIAYLLVLLVAVYAMKKEYWKDVH
jgi:ubiquinol-cytochrome c reductase cytochrome c1 subunit